MPVSGKSFSARGNHLLSLLSDNAYTKLAPMLHPVQLEIGQILHERGKLFSSDIYFPITCVLSVILTLSDEAAVEVGSVGNEGFSGVEILAGAKAPFHAYLCQIPGKAIRMSMTDFRQALDAVPELHKLALGSLQVFMAQAAQSVACNSQHAMESRFACWMLLTHDRVEGDDFKLTQEFMAQMLGGYRPTVSVVANRFQQAGLLRYSRGHVYILNRQGIEEAACECYFDVCNHSQRLLTTTDAGASSSILVLPAV
nr:Crp/Fnr family transcriptional regulator [uncultured Noviherbaspirillum sp.]